MAKIDGVIQFTGKLGQVVGMKGRNGRNFMRQRTQEIKNPRSQAQCIQRMILATVGASIAYLKAICNNSVEGKSNGADTLAYLRGEWMRMLRTSDILTSGKSFLKKGNNYFAVNPYLLSKGTLESPKVTIDTSNSAMIVEGMSNDAAVTPSLLFPNIRLGDQITFVGVFFNDEAGYPELKYCRFAFKTDAVPAVVDEDGSWKLNPEAIDLNKAEGDWRSLAFIFTERQIVTDQISPYDLIAGALIVSNEIEKKRSTTYLTLASGITPFYSAEEAWPTYSGVGTRVDVPSEVYLNNSTEVAATAPYLEGAPVTVERSNSIDLQVKGVYVAGATALESFRLKGNVYLQNGSVVYDLTSQELVGESSDLPVFLGDNYQGFVRQPIEIGEYVSCHVVLPANEQIIDKVVITGGTIRVSGVDYTF